MLPTLAEHHAIRPLYVLGDTWWGARGGLIFRARGAGRPTFVASLGVGARLEGACRWIRRALRRDASAAWALNEDELLIGSRRGIHRITHGRVQHELDPSPWRALRFSAWSGLGGFSDATAAFGGYGSAQEGVPIWVRNAAGSWRVACRLPVGAVDHIHALVPDHRRSRLWILAGDYGDRASIWCAQDDFADVRAVVTGQQAYRTCWAWVDDGGLLYATDSHLEPNSLRRLEESAGGRWASRRLAATNGSAIYATDAFGAPFFATAVEPGAPTGNFLIDMLEVRKGPGIADRRSVLYRVVDGKPMEVLSAKADWLPKRLFQFSTWILPPGRQAEVLPVYAMGLHSVDDRTLVFGRDAFA